MGAGLGIFTGYPHFSDRSAEKGKVAGAAADLATSGN
jgi:hypothetical protein